MPNVEVNWIHVAVLALGNFIISWAWYSPALFADPWAKALKIKMGRKMTKEEKAMMPWLFAGAIFSSLALAFVLQSLTLRLNITGIGDGIGLGLGAWLGFALTGSLGTLWEGRPVKVLLINNGLFIVTYALIGGISAVWH